MSGSGYDMSATTFSPEGRIFQVEYASKAVSEASTCVGINCKDGIVIAVEKTKSSPFVMEGSDKHVHIVSKHIGALIGGYAPDGRYAVDRARDHTVSFKDNFGEEMPPRVLTERMGQFIHQFTCYGSIRPLGINLIIAGYDTREKRYDLYRIVPVGRCYRHYAVASGKSQQECLAEIEKKTMTEMTVEEVMPHIAKMLCSVHAESKKPYEIEMGYIADETNQRFVRVEKDKLEGILQRAHEMLKQEENGEGDGHMVIED